MGYGSLWNDTWAEEFLSSCGKHEVALDFFSFHIYSEYPKLKVEEDRLTQIMPPSFYKESIDLLRQKMKASSYGHVELHVTEWNFSLYDRNLLHDTMFMAPFVIYHTMNTLGDVNAMAFGLLPMYSKKASFQLLLSMGLWSDQSRWSEET